MSKEELNTDRDSLDGTEESNKNLIDNENNAEKKEETSDKTILELKNRISQLEETNKDLKSKVSKFTKKQSLSTMLFVGTAATRFRKKYCCGIKAKMTR